MFSATLPDAVYEMYPYKAGIYTLVKRVTSDIDTSKCTGKTVSSIYKNEVVSLHMALC